MKTYLKILFCIFLLFISGCSILSLNLQYPNTFHPNFLADAPWRVSSITSEIPVIVYIKDTDKNHLKLYKISILDNSTNEIVREYSPENLMIKTTPFVYAFSNLTAKNFGIYSQGQKVDLTVIVTFKDFGIKHNFRQRFQVYVGEKLPTMENWYPGDIHFHSDYTNSRLETGVGLLKGDYYTGDAIIKRMGKSIGLDWVTVTDHSCDFGDDDYRTPRGGEESQWQKMAQDCRRFSDSEFIIIPGEEVTFDGENNHRTHLLAYETNQYIDGPEIGFFGKLFTDHHDKEFKNFSETFNEINKSNKGNGFCFAAHPLARADTVLGIHMKGLEWKEKTIQSALNERSFKGFEIWNTRITKKKKNISFSTKKLVNPFPWENKRHWDEELTNGIKMWDSYLLKNLSKPLKIFIEGGSDAHGHFNYAIVFRYIAKSIPFIDYVANDNAFGSVRTYIFSENGLNEKSILYALKNGHSIVTDGPLLVFGIDMDNDGELSVVKGDIIPGDICRIPVNTDVRFLIKWQSSSRYRDIKDGQIDKIIAVYGNENSLTAESKNIPYRKNENSCYWESVKSRDPMNSYYRLEGYVMDNNGNKKYRCYTNPIWIQWVK